MTNTKHKKEEKSIIEKLEKERKSRVIVYITGDKQPLQFFGTQIALDQLSLFKEVLEKMGKVKKISLVINTTGGMLETPWPLVNLIREYCETYEAIILEKSLSAGTMIALGADKIVMMPYSQLSPIDPAANIQDGNTNIQKRIEIEDIVGFIDFAKEKIGINEQSSLSELLKELTKEISPTMLGSVNRTHALIRKLAKDLLYLHTAKLTEKQIKEITENLTQKLYSHSYLINRREARDQVGFGKIIEFADEKTKELADNVINEYFEKLGLKKDFDPIDLLKEKSEKKISMNRAVIHSTEIKYDFVTDYKITKIPDPTGTPQIKIDALKNYWKK